MGAIKEILVPDIGDYKDVPVIEVLVKPGDRVAAEDSLVTLESDKATMEVPAPFAGVVKELKVKVGDKVGQGVLIMTLEVEDAGAAHPPLPLQRLRPLPQRLPRPLRPLLPRPPHRLRSQSRPHRHLPQPPSTKPRSPRPTQARRYAVSPANSASTWVVSRRRVRRAAFSRTTSRPS
jgi:pyruvate dehydrogenase E2 component (dihydrolipoamide acetyltransferase)